MLNKISSVLAVTAACALLNGALANGPNALNMEVVVTCSTEYRNTYSIEIFNNDSVEVACNEHEYTFDSSKQRIPLTGRYSYAVDANRSFGGSITFSEGFPAKGVLVAILCQADGREFRDLRFLLCPSH